MRIQGKRWVVAAFRKHDGRLIGGAGALQVRARCIGELFASAAWEHGYPAACVEVDAGEATANVRRGIRVFDAKVSDLARQAGVGIDQSQMRGAIETVIRSRAAATGRGWSIDAQLVNSAKLQDSAIVSNFRIQH